MAVVFACFFLLCVFSVMFCMRLLVALHVICLAVCLLKFELAAFVLRLCSRRVVCELVICCCCWVCCGLFSSLLQHAHCLIRCAIALLAFSHHVLHDGCLCTCLDKVDCSLFCCLCCAAPYGAHTTAADVLWAGVPVVTVLDNPRSAVCFCLSCCRVRA